MQHSIHGDLSCRPSWNCKGWCNSLFFTLYLLGDHYTLILWWKLAGLGSSATVVTCWHFSGRNQAMPGNKYLICINLKANNGAHLPICLNKLDTKFKKIQRYLFPKFWNQFSYNNMVLNGRFFSTRAAHRFCQGSLKLTSLGLERVASSSRHRCHSADLPQALAALGPKNLAKMVPSFTKMLDYRHYVLQPRVICIIRIQYVCIYIFYYVCI